jgi:superfamily II DNA or RNA helicase
VGGPTLKDAEWKSAYGPEDQPLEAFYLPALSRAVRYDRIAGFFSSYALAVAAQGVSTLVARGGRMRLLVGAQLSPEDVEAVLRGTSLQEHLAQPFLQLLHDPEALADALVKERLKVLAWLVAQDRLEIKVVVEADPYTRQPLPSGGYFHAKGGILWDEAGDGVAFSGSINETATAWRYNYERFHVFCSWREAEHFQQEARTFDRLWQNAEAGWLTLELPEAVRQKLVRMAPAEPPVEEPALLPVAQADARARWVAQFLRDAPFLVHGGWRVGVETAGVRPFPHQRAVAYSVLDRFPCRRLLADEVGLGKTIEAGLILRSLILSGWVKRCLIVVPRTLAKQWQEELRDRFLVKVPFFDGARFVYFGQPENRYEPVPEGKSPWEVHPIVLASAQMVKRQERAEALLQAPPWDMVIVDEAHHARRRDFLDLDRYRPNRLLALLEQLKERTRSLLLLTATPMQIHPVEVWDLLRLLGLPGRWQEDQGAFLAYFQQFRQPYEDVAWDLVLALLREVIRAWGWDPVWQQGARQALGPVGVHRLETLIQQGTARDALKLAAEQRQWLLEAVRRHSPFNRLAYRHTRSLLRNYHQRGLLKQHVPERRPQAKWLEMSSEEWQLYQAVEQYISTYYKRYEEVRRGLGFVMTVYRRRLTSSLYALRESLQKRRQFLLGQWRDEEHPMGLDDEDLEEADLDRDEAEGLGQQPVFWDEEVKVVDDLLERLAGLDTEQKLLALREDLQEALLRWDQVLVYTQYTDTMDFLRQELLPTFGARLGCYSGRGGEIWHAAGSKWIGMSKEKVQKEFAEGRLKVLLCTEAGGEGLNLQNCGVLFNYDMPWNPMKVEQRIGRVDRIGQRRHEVAIRHYFYERTVEAQVYRALGDRIGWFETVVGELQPILHTVQETIQKAALASLEERDTVLRQGLGALEQEWKEVQERVAPVSRWMPVDDPPGAKAPVSLDDLKELFTTEVPWKDKVLTSETDGLWRLVQESTIAWLTFDPEKLEGPGAETKALLCTYGSPSMDAMVKLPPPLSRPDLARLEHYERTRRVGYYWLEKSRWEPIREVRDLVPRLLHAPAETLPNISDPKVRFEQDCQQGPKGQFLLTLQER